MGLTRTKVERLEYDHDKGGAQRVWDDRVTGLGVRVHPSGTKSFILRYRTEGRERTMVVGPVALYSVTQARERASHLLRLVREGQDPLQRTAAPTVEELCSAYMERHSKPHKRSWKEDQRRIDKLILPRWRKRRLASITRAEVAEMHRRVGKNDGPYTANRLLALLSKMFELAKTWYMLGEDAPNPAKRIEKYKENSRERWVTPEELPRHVESIDQEANPYVRTAIWCYLLTGCRKTELLQAKWEHVDLDRGELRILETKNSRAAVVTLTTTAREMLRTLPRVEGNPHVFPGRMAGRHMVNIDKRWRKIRKRAGLDDVHIHDLRRTVGSWMAQGGASLLVIQKGLHHESYRSTLVYSRLSQDPVKEAFESHDTRLLAAAGKRKPGELVAIKGGK